MATQAELLAPQVIFESVTKEIVAVGEVLQRHLGMQLGGPHVQECMFNYGSYDVYNDTRVPAKGRAWMSGPATSAVQSVRQQPMTLANANEKVKVYYHQLHAMRPLGSPSSEIDQGGKNYLTRQETTLKQKFVNFREVMCAGVYRGSMQFLISGDDWLPVFSGGTFTVDFQVPSGNKGNVGGIIGTLWSTTASAKVFQNCLDINALSQQITGRPIRHAWCNSKIWGYITGNADLQSRAGTANQMYDRYDRTAGALDTSRAQDEFVAVLKPIPWLTWHIYDGSLVLNGTTTKLFPDSGQGSCVLTPDPDGDWLAMMVGSAFVAENEVDEPVNRRMPYFWPQYVREPAQIELVGQDICMPALRAPGSIFCCTVA